MLSSFLKLNLFDVAKGFLVAALTVILAGVYTSLQSGVFPTVANLEHLGITGLTAGLAYLLKNFLTNSNGTPLATENKPK